MSRVDGHGDRGRAERTVNAVELSDVAKSFHGTSVLQAIDLSVPRGQFVALLGPSGAGKSTLLRLINGMHKADAGRVQTLGVAVESCSRPQLRSLRRDVGFIFQQFGLVGRLTAMENVLMGALGSLRLPRYSVASYSRELRIQAVEQLERVGMADRRFQRCDTLSGGQQQRVAIARTLMQSPRLILADEPVASLDPASSATVLSMLAKIQQDGITVVCSLHQVDLAVQWAERLVALKSGRIVMDQAAGSVDVARVMQIYDPGQVQ